MRQADKIIAVIIILGVIAGIWALVDHYEPKIKYHQTKEKQFLSDVERCRKRPNSLWYTPRVKDVAQKAADRHKKKKDEAGLILFLGSLGIIAVGAGIFGFVRKGGNHNENK